jgi:hypothetical protein
MEPLNEDWMEIFETNVDHQHKLLHDRRMVDDLEPMLRDAVLLRELEHYDPGVWDPSMYNEEVKGTWPKENHDRR